MPVGIQSSKPSPVVGATSLVDPLAAKPFQSVGLFAVDPLAAKPSPVVGAFLVDPSGVLQVVGATMTIPVDILAARIGLDLLPALGLRTLAADLALPGPTTC